MKYSFKKIAGFLGGAIVVRISLVRGVVEFNLDLLFIDNSRHSFISNFEGTYQMRMYIARANDTLTHAYAVVHGFVTLGRVEGWRRLAAPLLCLSKTEWRLGAKPGHQ